MRELLHCESPKPPRHPAGGSLRLLRLSLCDIQTPSSPAEHLRSRARRVIIASIMIHSGADIDEGKKKAMEEPTQKPLESRAGLFLLIASTHNPAIAI